MQDYVAVFYFSSVRKTSLRLGLTRIAEGLFPSGQGLRPTLYQKRDELAVANGSAKLPSVSVFPPFTASRPSSCCRASHPAFRCVGVSGSGYCVMMGFYGQRVLYPTRAL